MNINDLNTIEQMEEFLTGSQAVAEHRLHSIRISLQTDPKSHGRPWF
ncbi:hypothetical protein [Methylobacter sp. S3L5C]|nr:hypothetical protein [Methylobacter sp. S3L5C]UOA07169.1 hypothetical protein KKZ03_12745 [Methylobacter sp. S3L5C]